MFTGDLYNVRGSTWVETRFQIEKIPITVYNLIIYSVLIYVFNLKQNTSHNLVFKLYVE